ncbi:endonuclease/exonuclease/phosphatase family protein [Candidatus Saccharibacteria bacterium]|nr:endonuclease/exonuclease/phosphatase family protein [Candidatus Saccharibacteria bacterium]
MKILQLNAWTGRMKGALKKFFAENEFDVICLQEAVWCDDKLLEEFTVTADQIKELSGLKHDIRGANYAFGAFGTKVMQGNVILSREEIVEGRIEVVHGEFLKLQSPEDVKRQGYTLEFAKLKSGVTIVCHHGYWLPTPVGDEVTVKVMKKVAGLIKEVDGPLVMCGDLNIIHDSPAMRELDFLRDLTDEYKIDNTLTGLKFDGKVACDHILVSDDVKVKSFGTLPDLISDHKPLVVETH